MRRTIAVLALSAALIVTAAGCKSSSSSSSSGGGKTTTGNAAAAGGGNLSANLPSSTNICSLLPAATVAQITGTAFDTGKPDSTASYQLFSCDYTSTKTLGAELDISVLGLDASPGYDADLSTYKQVGATITPIPGLGDKAFSTTIAGGAVGQIDTLFGKIGINLSGLSTLTADQAKQLATDLHGKLA